MHTFRKLYMYGVFFVFIFLFEAIVVTVKAEGSAGVWSGNAAFQGRGFWQNPQFNDQRDGYISLAFEPEYYKEWNNGLRAVTFTPFAR